MAVIKIVPMPGAKGDKGDDGATGAQGPQGPIGATGPAGADALWNYNGEWQSNATYAEGDIVTYNGETYRAIGTTTIGVAPSDGGFNLIASKGEAGPQGPKGDSANPKLISYTASGTSLDLSSYELNSLITIYRHPDYDCIQGTNFFIRALKTNGSNPVIGQAYLYGIVHSPNPSPNSISVVINKITNTFGDQNFNYFDFMTTGLPGEDGAIGPQGEPGTPGSLLNYWDGLSTPVPLPAEDGLVVIDGIVSSGGRNILVSADDRVFIGGNNGEFLNGLSTPENQIATIGDIENAISQSGSLTYKSGAVPATHHGVAGDTKNDIKYDDTHMYICVADYTDGSAVIWKRINWASGNW